MDVLLRESAFGRILNYLSNGNLFRAPDHAGSKSEVTTSESPSPTSPDALDLILVDFSGPDDPDIPRNWPMLAKAVAMIDVMLLNFSFYAASAIFTPSIPLIEKDLGATTAEGTLGLSLFVIAYGIGPLIVRRHLPFTYDLYLFANDGMLPAFSSVQLTLDWTHSGVCSRLFCFLPV